MTSSACDRRAPHRHLDRDAPPREPVRALTADLHRRGGGDRQLDLAAEALEPRSSSSRDGRLVRSTTSPSGSPVDVASREVDVREVALVEPDEAIRRSLRRRTGQHEQQPRRERVERPGVTGPRARPPADLRDDRERRRPGRLVDEHDAGGLSARAAARCAATNSRRMKSVISSIDASLEKPAACRWPPPPDIRAIAETSSSSIARAQRDAPRRAGRRAAARGSAPPARLPRPRAGSR